MPINIPPKMPVPWATSGLKNTIPATSSPVTGNAGYDQGFTAINMTPRTAGGIPPFGQDFNGIFYAVTEALRYLETGAGFPYDGAFATAVGGYPLGARVQRTDGYGSWLNTSANNTTDPEAFGSGWAPEGSGTAGVVMSNANVTLTALQAARDIIVVTGSLTADLSLIFPSYQKSWVVVNNTSGSFTVTAKTASGGGVTLGSLSNTVVYGDGVSILPAIRGVSMFPAGIPLDWAGMSPPSWAVVRDGAALSRLSYALLYAAVCPTRRGTLTSGSASVTGLSTTLDMWVGMPIEGTGIPAGATVASLTSTSAATLSVNATVSGTQTLTIFPFGYGNGGGVATFGVPDDRGLHTRSYDSGRGYEQSTLTANTTNANNALSGIASTRGLYVGMPVSGPGIPANTSIAIISGTNIIYLSNNATATATAVALTVTGRQIGAEGVDEIKAHTHRQIWDQSGAPGSTSGAVGSLLSSPTIITGSTGGPENNVKRRVYLPIITLGV